MGTRRARAVVLAALVAVAAAPARAAPGAGAPAPAERRHWLLPDQAKLQLAGAIGLVAAGGGWALLDRRLELDLLAGWVPESLAGFELFALTGKVTWLPWTLSLDGRRLGALPLDGWRLRPFTLATAFTYTFGSQFFVRLPDHHPPGYYPLPTAIRASVAVGGTLGRPAGRFRQAGVYWEVVAVDLPLAYWLSNQRAVDATDVLSVALGARLEL